MSKFEGKIYFSLAVILILFLSGRGLLAHAAMIEKIEIDLDKRITVTGACNDGVLNVQIFSATSSQPFYTAGVACQENKFEFKDDLGYWKIPDGDYSITILGKDDNLVNSSTAVFKIETIAPPASEANTVESGVDWENNPVNIQENEEMKTDVASQDIKVDQAAVQESPSDGLFAQVINFLVEWFKSAVVLIKELVAERIITPELCLGDTCLTENRLKDLLGEKQKIDLPPASDATSTLNN